jgi:Fur family ferric uptake transcriptional regulator
VLTEEIELTTTHRSPALSATNIEAAVKALRERGLRVSAARRLVLEALYGAEGPLSAERIAQGLEGRLPRSDLASVYRNLETLESCHAVRTVAKAELDGIRSQVLDRFGFEARFTHFPLVGLCPRCLSESHDHEENEHAHP